MAMAVGLSREQAEAVFVHNGMSEDASRIVVGDAVMCGRFEFTFHKRIMAVEYDGESYTVIC